MIVIIIIINIAIFEIFCVNSECLRIDRFSSLQNDDQIFCDISNLSSKYLIENDEYVVILQKLIENELRNCSKKEQNTQSFEIKNHDFMKDVSKKSFEVIFDQKSSN